VDHYRKIHLFDVDIKNGPQLMESRHTVAGDKIATPIPTPVGQIGLGICYDLRFPELALALRRKGAEILTYPSAFTIKTGEAHWGNFAQQQRAYLVKGEIIGATNINLIFRTRLEMT
jgi:predicted amidohydrolase